MTQNPGNIKLALIRNNAEKFSDKTKRGKQRTKSHQGRIAGKILRHLQKKKPIKVKAVLAKKMLPKKQKTNPKKKGQKLQLTQKK